MRIVVRLMLAGLIASTLGCESSSTVTDALPADSVLGQELGTVHPRLWSFSAVAPATWATATWPQGARFVNGEGSDLQVGVYSEHATRILLEIYTQATGAPAKYDYWMVKGADNIWRAQVRSVPGKTLYAFRAWGPNWPYDVAWARGGSSAGFISDVDSAGNRFDPNKVLFDPYARELSHDKSTQAIIAKGLDGKMYGTGNAQYQGVARRNFDTGPWAPKAVALVDHTSFGTKPNIAAKDSIIYEAHVRGLTAHPSSMTLGTLLSGTSGFEAVTNIPEACRGTYQAAGLMAPYLKGLGVNVIELLPVHESSNDTISLSSPSGNYWGYTTDGFFAPDRHYACDRSLGGPTAEFKSMVAAFHAAGLEVWLDVVYNHTGEGGNWDSSGDVAELTSFRGFDNSNFYALVGGNPSSYWETSGVGNNFNVTTSAGRRLVLDSLAYWTQSMGVDGFRFDLASELGRDTAPSYNFNANAQLLKDISAYAQAQSVEVIAEPWDIGAYTVGQFPAGWGEWNGKYRDASRRFLKGDTSGSSGTSYADAFYGSFNDYNDQGGAKRSVNFLVAHDGFTLADLVSYNSKTNTLRLWPFGPSDGGNDSNDSWDSGGDHSLRRQRLRNAWVWQVFSRGPMMLVAGDEFARTQNGNNNPYNLDTVATWNNYAMIASDSPQAVPTQDTGENYHDNLGPDGNADGRNGIFTFVRQLLAMRKSSSALRQGDYAMPMYFSKFDGSSGYNSWADRAVRIHLDGSQVGDTDYLLFVNMFTAPLNFTAPAADPGKTWVRVLDTATWAESVGNSWPEDSAAPFNQSYGVQPWSIAVFKEVTLNVQTTTAVTFHCDGCTTVTGQDVYVVGNTPELGNWVTSAAIKLSPSAYPTWTGAVTLPVTKAIDYKFIKVNGAGQVIWEGGSNRAYTTPTTGTGTTGGTWQ